MWSVLVVIDEGMCDSLVAPELRNRFVVVTLTCPFESNSVSGLFVT
jgi:hypothetical protein